MVCIALVAPSYPVHAHEISGIKEYLIRIGFDIFIPSNLTQGPFYLTSSMQQRFFLLKEALESPAVDIIWSLGGGYGLTQLAPLIAGITQPEKKKILIGFSDSTALHVILNQFWNWDSIHGPFASQMYNKSISEESISLILGHILNKEYLSEIIEHKHLKAVPLNSEAQDCGTLSGIVVGGNLSVVQCSIGTKWEINTKCKIFYLEEIYERGYRVDRMLSHLKQAGKFSDINAIAFGDFLNCNEPDGSILVPQILDNFCKSIKIPAYYFPDTGHGQKNSFISFGKKSSFAINPNSINSLLN